MNEKPHRPKLPSLADFLIRYELPAMIEEARLDYTQATSGVSHHLTQQDIAARFRNMRQPNPNKPSHE